MLCSLGGLVLFIVAVVVVLFGVLPRFSYEAQLEARFSDAIWTPIASWGEDPVDVSEKVCAKVDEKLRAEIERRPRWSLEFGNCFFTQERVFIISFDEAGQCRATIDVVPPSCAL